MPKLTIDATEATSFEPIPSGTYDARISTIKEPRTSAKGTEYIPIGFEVVDGDYEGRWIWSNFMLSGKGVGITLDFINKALGTEYSAADEEFDFDFDDLIGAEVQLVTALEEYEGQEREQVKRILAK